MQYECRHSACNLCNHGEWDVAIKVVDVNMTMRAACSTCKKPNIYIRKEKSKRIEYCAISYFWDKGEWEANVQCGNSVDTIRIKSCLYTSFIAMLDICKQGGFEYVWIDAICIEQTASMGGSDILIGQLAEAGYYYRHASRCIVFPNGLNMYAPPSVLNGSPSKWHSRVWTLQENCMTFYSKKYVFALPKVVLGYIDKHAYDGLSSSIPSKYKTINLSPLHIECISRGYTEGHIEGVSVMLSTRDTQSWGLVLTDVLGTLKVANGWFDCVEKNLVPRYYVPSHSDVKVYKEWFQTYVDIHDQSTAQILRETMKRACMYEHDRIYSIMSTLNIKLHACYSKEITVGNLIKQAAEKVKASYLIGFVVADMYSTTCSGDCTLPTGDTAIDTKHGVYTHDYVDTISYTIDSGMTITTLSSIATCYKHEHDNIDAEYGHLFLIHISINKYVARGYINSASKFDRVLLLYIGQDSIIERALEWKTGGIACIFLVAYFDSNHVLHKCGIVGMPLRKDQLIGPLWETKTYLFCRRPSV